MKRAKVEGGLIGNDADHERAAVNAAKALADHVASLRGCAGFRFKHNGCVVTVTRKANKGAK